jgi:peroxiredoxin
LLIGLIAGTTGDTGSAWDNTHAYLGVGDSATAAVATQTGLQAATNKTYKAMDSTFPTRATQVCTWQATFASGDANYSWQEYTVVNASSDTGKNLNRVCADKGTKASGETWTLQLAITFS